MSNIHTLIINIFIIPTLIILLYLFKGKADILIVHFMKHLLLIIFLHSLPVFLNAQDTIHESSSMKSELFLGLGLGLDYGGTLGVNLTYFPHERVGIFAGAGNAVSSVGYTIGSTYRLLPKKAESKFIPYIEGMYGFNAAVIIHFNNKKNRQFYGPTIGIGLEYHHHPENLNYWAFDILLPIRSPEVKEYLDDLKNNQGIIFNHNLSPVLISFGYRHSFNKSRKDHQAVHGI